MRKNQNIRSLNTGLNTEYVKRLIFSWSKAVKITCTTSTSGVALLVLHTGLCIFHTSGGVMVLGYDATQGITKQINGLTVTVSVASGQNLTGAILPLRGTWEIASD